MSKYCVRYRNIVRDEIIINEEAKKKNSMQTRAQTSCYCLLHEDDGRGRCACMRSTFLQIFCSNKRHLNTEYIFVYLTTIKYETISY